MKADFLIVLLSGVLVFFAKSLSRSPFAGVAWWSCSSLDDDWGRAASLGRADTDEYIELVLRSKLSGLGGDFVGATLLRLSPACSPAACRLGSRRGRGATFAVLLLRPNGQQLRADSRAPGPARRPCSAVRPGTARKLIFAADPTGDLTKKRAKFLPRSSARRPTSLLRGIDGELTRLVAA